MLSTQTNSDLQKLLTMSLNEDVRQQAAVEILSGKSFDVALRHARAEIARQARPCGFVRLDLEGDEACGLHEQLAAPPQEELERWRVAQLDSATESLMAKLAGGTAALGRSLGVTRRRAQQLVALHVARAELGDLFEEGGEA